MLLRDAVDGYMLSLQAGRASPRTVAIYGKLLGRLVDFAEAHGRPKVNELTIHLARAWVVDLMGDPDEEGHGATWKGGEGMAFIGVCALRGLGQCLRTEGHEVPDFHAIPLPKRPERIQPRVTPEEFQAMESVVLKRLLSGSSPRWLVARDMAILSVLADTGLRAAEFCALQVDDVDLEDGTLTVRSGKGRKPRVLNIRDDDPDERDGGPTMRALSDYLRFRAQVFGARSRQRVLWLTSKGSPLKPPELRRALARICDDAGLDGNRPPHAFRRAAFSTAYRQRPTALPELSARMGWSPRSDMVDVYTRGAEIDFARERPQPSVAKLWRSTPIPVTRSSKRTFTLGGAVPGVDRANRPAAPSLGRADATRTASANSRRGLRPPR